MLGKIFLFITGFCLIVLGLTCNILYINLLEFGYNFKEYIMCIIYNAYIYYVILGLIIINIVFLKKEKKI